MHQVLKNMNIEFLQRSATSEASPTVIEVPMTDDEVSRRRETASMH